MFPSFWVSSDYPAALIMHPASRELVMSVKGQARRLLRSLWVSSLRTERAKSSRSLQRARVPHKSYWLLSKGQLGWITGSTKFNGNISSCGQAKSSPLFFLLVWCMPLCSIMEAVNLWDSCVDTDLTKSPYYCHPTSFTITSTEQKLPSSNLNIGPLETFSA